MNVLPPYHAFPAPFNLPPQERPAPYNLPPNQRAGALANHVTDFDRTLGVLGQIPQLSAAGAPITLLAGTHPWSQLPGGLVPRYLVQDGWIGELVGPNAGCLCARGVGISALLVAQGNDGHGQPVIAMLQTKRRAGRAVAAMRNLMTVRGVAHYTTMVLGGMVSRNPAYPGMDIAFSLAEAAQQDGTLAHGRIGVVQTPQALVDMVATQSSNDPVLPVLPGLGQGLFCAVMTTQGLYYAMEDANGPTLFVADLEAAAGNPL